MTQAPPPNSTPPKDAATGSKPAAGKAAPKAATPAAKKKKGGFRWRLYLFILVVLAGAAVYYLPKQVESLTGVKIPSFIPSHSTAAERIPKPVPPKKGSETVRIPKPVPPKEGTASTATAEDDSMEVLSTRVRQLHAMVAMSLPILGRRTHDPILGLLADEIGDEAWVGRGVPSCQSLPTWKA